MRDQVIRILKENVIDLETVDINDETEFISEGYMESFDVINLISVFEKEFNVSISLEETDFEDFNKLDSIIKLIEGAKSE